MFHTYSLNLVTMNKLVELKGNDKLKMQNDKNYANFWKANKFVKCQFMKVLFMTFLSKFGSKHHFGLQISINIGILHNSISIKWIMFIIN